MSDLLDLYLSLVHLVLRAVDRAVEGRRDVLLADVKRARVVEEAVVAFAYQRDDQFEPAQFRIALAQVALHGVVNDADAHRRR